jgi:hypothetical protein
MNTMKLHHYLLSVLVLISVDSMILSDESKSSATTAISLPTNESQRTRTVYVTLRIASEIYPAKEGEPPKTDPFLNRTNLISVKKFILKQGLTQTYCNMYGNNPAYSVDKYRFYLNPDPAGPNGHPQHNIHCDPKLTDFQTLVMHNVKWGYIYIEFKEERMISIDVTWPDDELNVKTIRDRAEEGLKVILEEVKKHSRENKSETQNQRQSN